MKIVLALGGNALGADPIQQKEMVAETARQLAPLILDGHKIVITHGNGPQIGLISLAFSDGHKANDKIFEMSFSECGAMSQGYIGYYLQNAIINELKKFGVNKNVVSLVTQIEVDPKDPAFDNPTKPIGIYYTKEEASKLDFPMKEFPKKGFRRVIASPKPVKVIEEQTIKTLIDNDVVVITCGGGGIPVVKDGNNYQGIDAVIDKDYASSKLASDIDSDCLFILTAIEQVAINYGKPNEERLSVVKVDDLIKYNKEGHFGAGSMGPKVEACIDFVKSNPQHVAYITSIEKASLALEGKAGTKIIY